MRRLSFPQLLIVFLIALAPLRPLSAQVPSPPLGSDVTPYVPDPAACNVEPIDREVLLDLWFPPEGTPIPPGIIDSTESTVTLPVGPAADTETLMSITETLHSFYDCVAAADFTRYLVYFTDGMIQRFGPDPFPTRAACIGFLDNYPHPTPSTNPTQIVAVTNVMILGGGHAAALVVDIGRAGTFTTYVVFELQDDGRWLVDEVYQFSPC